MSEWISFFFPLHLTAGILTLKRVLGFCSEKVVKRKLLKQIMIRDKSDPCTPLHFITLFWCQMQLGDCSQNLDSKMSQKIECSCFCTNDKKCDDDYALFQDQLYP